MSGDTTRTIKLYCPCLSKIVQLVTWDEQRLDLGSIARTFGLEPATLKLNGHFISRGVDLIASSVTWKYLISFFSSRGLSTGATEFDALIVDGKLSKVGFKRAHDPAYVENGTFSTREYAHSCSDGRPQPEDAILLNTKRLKDSNSGLVDRINQITTCSSLSLKRKFSSEDLSSLKRIRTDESDLVPWTRNDDLPKTSPNSPIAVPWTRNDDLSNIIPNSQLPCSFISENTKRMREDEMLLAAPCKRTR